MPGLITIFPAKVVSFKQLGGKLCSYQKCNKAASSHKHGRAKWVPTKRSLGGTGFCELKVFSFDFGDREHDVTLFTWVKKS